MTVSEWVITGLSIISVLLIPVLVLMFRGAVKWTRTEDKLSVLIDDVRELINDKDKVHQEILEQMRQDREATNTRITYIERFWMEQGREQIRTRTR